LRHSGRAQIEAAACSSSSTPLRCFTAMWSTAPLCAAAKTLRTKCPAAGRVCTWGDFLCARAFQMLAAFNSQPVMEIMVEAINMMSEGRGAAAHARARS
jgi:hypothetical protein